MAHSPTTSLQWYYSTAPSFRHRGPPRILGSAGCAVRVLPPAGLSLHPPPARALLLGSRSAEGGNAHGPIPPSLAPSYRGYSAHCSRDHQPPRWGWVQRGEESPVHPQELYGCTWYQTAPPPGCLPPTETSPQSR